MPQPPCSRTSGTQATNVATNSSSLTLSVFDLADPIRASTVGNSVELLGTGFGQSSRAASGLTRPRGQRLGLA
ncbi:hypothetical protein SLA2020_266160 [Shorea laevis]